MSRTALAEQAGVSAASIKNIEKERPATGKHSALHILAAIARYDPDRARWIAEATDAPEGATKVLGERLPGVP